MTKPSLLIVDDNRVNLMVLRLVLVRAGYCPLEARDGLEAVTLALAKKPDLILMDIMMPRMDGIAAAREIFDRVSGTPPRIVAVTGNTVESLKEECLAAGFAAVLHKPIDARELLATVDRLFMQPAEADGKPSELDCAPCARPEMVSRRRLLESEFVEQQPGREKNRDVSGVKSWWNFHPRATTLRQ